MARLEREGDHSSWALQLQVMAEASWPRVRQQQRGLADTDACPRCGQRETLFHRVWTCPCNQGHQDYTSTQSLLEKATQGHETTPCLWLRGLPPASWTRYTCPEGVSNFERKTGCWEDVEGQRGEDGFLDVFGDGSGGKHSADPRLRQCGVGVAVLQTFNDGEDPQLLAGIVAGLPGPRQTVPRAELWAFLLALRSTSGDLRYHTDNMPLVSGWSRGRHRLPPRGKMLIYGWPFGLQ